MTKVVKRDGTIVDYDLEKIAIAISGAFDETDSVFDDINMLLDIEKKVLKQDEITVEEIQYIVEESLWKFKYVKEARKYMKYRYEHELARAKRREEAVASKIKATNIENQNANIDELSFGGRKGEAGNVVMKDYALEHCVSKMARRNHENNEIYIHDLDSYAVGQHNSLSIPFDHLLKNGFNTRQTDVRPANSVNTAFQLVAVIFQLQSLQQFG